MYSRALTVALSTLDRKFGRNGEDISSSTRRAEKAVHMMHYPISTDHTGIVVSMMDENP